MKVKKGLSKRSGDCPSGQSVAVLMYSAVEMLSYRLI